MIRIWLILAIFLAGCGGGLSLEISTPTPPRPAPTPRVFFPRAPVRQDVILFTGTTSLTTQPFEISTSSWELKWSLEWYTLDQKKMTVLVFPRGERENSVATIESTERPEDSLEFSVEGSAHLEVGPGEFFLSILAPDVPKWSIEIHQ